MSDAMICPQCRRSMPAGTDISESGCPYCEPAIPPLPSAATPSNVTARLPRAPLPPDGYEDEDAARLRRRRRHALDDDLGAPAPAFSLAALRPTAGIAIAAKAMLGIIIAICVAILIGDMMQHRLALRLIAGEEIPHNELVSNDLRQQGLKIGYLICYIVTAIVFLVWFYRAYANLRPLGATRLNQTPGWAVGVWFLPIMNLFRPVQAAQEIWRNSDPAAVDGDDLDSSRSPNSTVIGLWWTAWIADMLINHVSSEMARAVNSPTTLEAATIADAFAQTTAIVGATLAIAVVHAIEFRQRARAEALEATFDAPV
jgi:Domain of unknown function (DUF4328)